MVPRITSKGRSFKGAGAYFLHDLGKATTSERVEFTHTVNMLCDDPQRAIKVMAWTAEHAQDLKQVSGQKMTGRKAENPVFNYVLSWSPDLNPDRNHMIELGMRSLNALGLAEHEALFVSHNDTDHKHLHVIASRVHPVTGLLKNMAHDRNHLSRLAQAYCEEIGRPDLCPQRAINNRRRDLGERNVKDRESLTVNETQAYADRRAERIEAQRKAAAVHLERMKGQDAKATAARDMRAGFDQASAHDDRQYRAKELTRPAVEERDQAAKAWADERLKERERIKCEGDTKANALKEQARRAWTDKTRSAEWTEYEARQWSALNEKQTQRREGLHDQQTDRRARFEERLGRKYGADEKLLQGQFDALRHKLEQQGARGLLDRLTGARGQAVAQLETMTKALDKLDRQKAQERAGLAERQKAERAEQAKRQEIERTRKADTLKAVKTKQDAAFEQQERERSERMRHQTDRRENRAEQAKELAMEARRQAAREHVQRTDQAREERAQETLGRTQQQELGLGG